MVVRPDTDVQDPPPGSHERRGWRWDLALPVVAVVVGVAVIGMITRPDPGGPEWVAHIGPTGPINLDSLTATDSGFAVLSGVTEDGVLLWWSEDGTDWRSTPLDATPIRLAASDDLLAAYDGREALILALIDGSWEVREEVAFPDEMRAGQSAGRPGLVAGPGGFVMTSIVGDVWWWDLEGFEQVVTNPAWGPGETVEVPFDSSCRPPTRVSPDVPPMAAADIGVVTLVAGNPEEPFGMWPVCEPTAWVSDDGRSWTTTDDKLGEGAYVYNIAWRDGRFVAVGGTGIGEPAVWSSPDGEQWDPFSGFETGSGVDLYTVRAGGAGWAILGQETETSRPVGWVSADATCWTRLPVGVDGDDAAVTETQIMLVQSVTFPETWVTDVAAGQGC
jgi:hypothetical protein